MSTIFTATEILNTPVTFGKQWPISGAISAAVDRQMTGREGGSLIILHRRRARTFLFSLSPSPSFPASARQWRESSPGELESEFPIFGSRGEAADFANVND